MPTKRRSISTCRPQSCTIFIFIFHFYNAWPNIDCRWPCGSMVDWTKGGDCASEAQCGELNAKYLRRLFAPLSLCLSVFLPLCLSASLPLRSLSLCLSALRYTNFFTGQVLRRTATPAACQPAVLVRGNNEHVRMGNSSSTSPNKSPFCAATHRTVIRYRRLVDRGRYMCKGSARQKGVLSL